MGLLGLLGTDLADSPPRPGNAREKEGAMLEKLYELLERAKKEHDSEAAAALRWAIFTLENM